MTGPFIQSVNLEATGSTVDGTRPLPPGRACTLPELFPSGTDDLSTSDLPPAAPRFPGGEDMMDVERATMGGTRHPGRVRAVHIIMNPLPSEIAAAWPRVRWGAWFDGLFRGRSSALETMSIDRAPVSRLENVIVSRAATQTTYCRQSEAPTNARGTRIRV